MGEMQSWVFRNSQVNRDDFGGNESNCFLANCGLFSMLETSGKSEKEKLAKLVKAVEANIDLKTAGGKILNEKIK